LSRLLVTLVVIPILMATSFSAKGAKSSNPYPNELPGFKFYAKYLYPLRPSESSRTQVVKVLGSDGLVEVGEWEITSGYLAEIPRPNGGDDHNRLAGILIKPKKRVSMLGIKFPAAFSHHMAEITEDEGGAFDVYSDRFGLAYWIRGGNTIAGENGDLLQIEYGPPR
jgi:hypothetical protein